MTELTEREVKTRVGWKGTSDRCKNCEQFEPCVFSQPPMIPGAPGVKGKPPICLLHGFKTYPTSWCRDHQRFKPRSKGDSEQG